MSDLFGNHIVGFPTRRLMSIDLSLALQYPFGRKDQNCDIHWHCINFEQNLDVFSGKVNKFPGG